MSRADMNVTRRGAIRAAGVLAASAFLTSCGTDASSDGQGSGAQQAQPTTRKLEDFRKTDLGTGQQPADSMALDYATCFSVDYYEGGHKLLCLADGGRYLVVPEGATAPEGLNGDIVVLRQPVSDIYLVASDAMCLFDALGQVGRVTVSGIRQDDWSIPSAVEAMQSGAMAYGGKYSAPDYDLLLAKGVRLAVESTMINHTPDVKEKLTELGIPVLTEMSSYETDPLGRTEWVRLYGALFDLEDQAQQLFDEQVAQAQAAMGQQTGKTVAFFYINSNGSAVVRKPGDYVTKMIEYAGGEYVFSNLETDTGRSTVTLEMEKLYEQAKDADYVIYNASIDGELMTVDQLLAKNELLADFRAVKNGNVWCTTQDMYQQMMQAGAIIGNFHTVLTDPSATELEFMYRLG